MVNKPVAKKPNLHRYKLFCYVCKKHFEYWELNKADALKKFDMLGHDNRKKKVLKKNLGRGIIERQVWRRATGRRAGSRQK